MKPGELITRRTLLIIAGCVILGAGFVMMITSPILLEHVTNSELMLSPRKKTYEMWRVPPISLALDFYLYNWTNPESLQDAKPVLEQLGPYRFKENKEKVDITWNDNGTVSFRQLRKWYFDEEGSQGSLDDAVTTLNIVAVTAAFQARYFSFMMQKGLSFSLSTLVNKVHVTKTAGELLFDGYEDTLIDMAKSLPAFAGITIPPYDKFGWFYLRNGSTDFDGYFNMGTGAGGVPLGELRNWNAKPRTAFFAGDCGRVHGSAGEFWPPRRTRASISLFSPDLCRNVEYDFDGTADVMGLTGYKYTGAARMMDNGTKYPENACYCNGECVPSGVLNVSSCRYGSPGFVSFPHFYNADPYFVNQVEGLAPNKEKHEFYIVLEPRTGIPLDVAARFQINILLQPIEQITLFREVPKIFFPILWFEQRASITKELADELRLVLNLPFVMKMISTVIISVGLTMLTGVGIHWAIGRYHKIARKRAKSMYMTREEIPLNDHGPKIIIK